MTRKRTGSYVWVTWLSRLMAGEVQCVWAPWFRTHFTEYKRPPSDVQLAQWQAEHTRLLLELAGEREALGEIVYRETQNRFQVRWPSGVVLAGAPDLVAIDRDRNVVVYDVKTGQQRQSDLIQVMLYTLCLPAGSPIYKGRRVSGCVVYKSGERAAVPSEAISVDFRETARYFLDLLDSETSPRRRPSVHECRYCDITRDDCNDRIERSDDTVEENIPSIEW